MLMKRILTAIVLIPLIFAAIIWMQPVYFSIGLGVIILIGAWEWSGFLKMRQCYQRVFYVVSVALGMFFFMLDFTPIANFLLLITAVLIWIWAFFAVICYQRAGGGAGFQSPVICAVTGWIILIATWLSITLLKSNATFGPAWLILLLVIIWGADSGGFFVGRMFGKKTLCSRVSPKKTWAGFWGGVTLSMIIAVVGAFLLSLNFLQSIDFLLLALITVLFSVAGDLGVSLLKRLSGIKDSGKFFPGHGGVLDRLDSIAAGAVVFVLGLLLFGT